MQAQLSSTGESFINAIDPFSLSALCIHDQKPLLNATITGAEPWAQDLALTTTGKDLVQIYWSCDLWMYKLCACVMQESERRKIKDRN
jgi:hypothetical protein